jgi:aspartyl-tRNA(Asn)/glutamyl-tRNA(Gln) amidotransferase subunit C
MPLSADEVRWVAHLARLELTQADLEIMTRHLQSIINYIDQLQQVNTANVEPLTHPLLIQNIFRDDNPVPSLPVDAALANAPGRRGNFFAVPAVLD